MKAYFNSTDTTRSQHDYKKRCPTYDPAKVCAIPSQMTAPDQSQGPSAAKTYFFSQEKDMTPGQTVFGNAAPPSRVPLLSIAVPLLVAMLGWALT